MSMNTALAVIAALSFPVSSAPAVASDVVLKCGGLGYTAKYSPASKFNPTIVDVTFRGQPPTSAAAEAALRKCITEASNVMFITSEMLASAWYSNSGREEDDELVALSDGSDHLAFDPKTKKTQTWKEREGEKHTVSAVAPAGYFVEYEEHLVLVSPGGKFADLNLVFSKPPSEKIAYESAVAEIGKAIQKNGGNMPTTAYVSVGTRANPAGWYQLKGSDGKFVSIAFDPKRSKHLTDVSGRDLGAPPTHGLETPRAN